MFRPVYTIQVGILNLFDRSLRAISVAATVRSILVAVIRSQEYNPLYRECASPRGGLVQQTFSAMLHTTDKCLDVMH